MVRVGRGVRALRRRLGWRQVDLGRKAGVSASAVGRIERGSGANLTARNIERVAHALGARLIVRLDWNGESLDRLLDAEHATLVERVVTELQALGWIVLTEVTFAIDGERGSVDVLAFHPQTRMLLVVEVKSVVADVQATLVGIDRKARLGPRIARLQGWSPAGVARLLVIGESRTARRRVEAHAATFGSQLPDRGLSVRRWLAAPSATAPLRGLWFLPGSRALAARHRVVKARTPR